jgi:hypothetical protein
MANANTPMGLSPVEYLGGAQWNGKARRYYIPSTDNNAFAIGDPVVLAGDADASGVASITLATAGSAFLGAIVGMGGTQYGGPSVDPTNLNTTVIPATKTRGYYVLVADDPNIIFEVQEIGTGTQLTSAAVGLNCNLVAGTNSGYLSGWLLDNTTEASTSTLDVKLLGLKQVSNNAFGAYAKWLVLINNHVYRGGVTGK